MTEISYPFPNAFFRKGDPQAQFVGGFEVPSGWWSRRFEYQWAMTHAAAGQVVGDFGCGWHYRPLHDYLANVCEFTYGVDHHKEVLDLPPMQKGTFVVADFSQPIPVIPAESLDRIFCISVLEVLINYEMALSEMKRLLKPEGLIILTCDIPHDANKPAHDTYKGVKLDELEAAIARTGLAYEGSINRVRYDDLLSHTDFNLCVWHCVLKHTAKAKTNAPDA